MSPMPLCNQPLHYEIGFSIHPVLLGCGVPAFRPFEHRIDLKLVGARAIAPECVLVRYHVVN